MGQDAEEESTWLYHGTDFDFGLVLRLDIVNDTLATTLNRVLTLKFCEMKTVKYVEYFSLMAPLISMD